MRSRRLIAVVVTVLLSVLLVGRAPLAQVTKPYGAATPQDAVAAIKKATAAGDFVAALPLIAPDGLKSIANEGVSGVLLLLAFSDPDDPMPGTPKPSKAELDANRKKYRDAVDLVKQTLKPYALDTLVGKPVMAADTQKAVDAAIDKADNVALISSLFNMMVKVAPSLGIKEKPKPELPVDVGTVTAYKITGDKATAQNGAKTLDFVRIDGRWYIQAPASKTGAVASSAAAAPAGQTAAPRAATGTQPEVVVAGIQVVKVAVSEADFGAKPFHADNGTHLGLWIRMPAGQGLIEIDERASLLQHFGDDKGTDLGGKFGSFPEVFKNGSGGVLEIESSGLPASGALALLAEGSLAVTTATGTKKTRVNFRAQNDQKFSFGTTPVTVAGVDAQSDSLSFTFNLPRQVMVGIKDVQFFDATGKPIESSRTGSGYMNDAAEMSFSVKTTSRSLTVEFEAWTGMKTIKVPFKVKAGLGLS